MKTIIDYSGVEIDIKAFQHALQEWPSYASKHLDDEGTAFLGNVVKQEVDGATVEGNGTLQFPLRAKLTPLQKAAPELLEALKELHALLNEHEPNWYLKLHYNHAKQAINKAIEG